MKTPTLLDPVHRMYVRKSVKRHASLLLKPLLVSLVIVYVWRFMHRYGIDLGKLSEVPITATIVPALLIMFGFPAGLVFNSVYDSYRKMIVAVIEHDRHTYLLYRDERVPKLIHMFLGIVAVVVLMGVMLIDYEHEWSGIFAVWSTSFLMALYFAVVHRLDDPRKTSWFRGRVDPSWDMIDLDEYRKAIRARKIAEEWYPAKRPAAAVEPSPNGSHGPNGSGHPAAAGSETAARV